MHLKSLPHIYVGPKNSSHFSKLETTLVPYGGAKFRKQYRVTDHAPFPGWFITQRHVFIINQCSKFEMPDFTCIKDKTMVLKFKKMSREENKQRYIAGKNWQGLDPPWERGDPHWKRIKKKLGVRFWPPLDRCQWITWCMSWAMSVLMEHEIFISI